MIRGRALLADKRRLPFSCAIAALAALAVVTYAYFHISAGGVKQADGIDFSSLANIVSIEEYSPAQSPEISAGRKHHQLVIDLPPLPAAPTAGAKADFAMPSDLGANLQILVEKNAAKLQAHLEQGFVPQDSTIAGVAETATDVPPSPRAAPLGQAVVKISNVRNGVAGGLGLSNSGNRPSARGGPVSGLLR